MPQHCPLAVKEQARELFVVEGLSHAHIARRLGVSIQAVRKWSAAERWSEKRVQYIQARLQIKHQLIELQQKLLERALETLDPQVIYALARLIAAGKGQPQAAADDTDSCVVKDLEELKRRIREELYGL